MAHDPGQLVHPAVVAIKAFVLEERRIFFFDVCFGSEIHMCLCLLATGGGEEVAGSCRGCNQRK